jgi:hypothetical protein
VNIREQAEILLTEGAKFVIVGGQAGVLRQAIEFSHDLDVLVEATRENAIRVGAAVRRITRIEPDVELLLGRDFQQYVDEQTGAELDVHLKLIALPDYASGLRNASEVDFLGLRVPVLELPALYASKRTDRPRDALHRRAIEDRLRTLVLAQRAAPDPIVLACCLDAELAALPTVGPSLPSLARSTEQPLLQARLLALGSHDDALAANPQLHAALRTLRSLDPILRAKVLDRPERFAALLARLPLVLPKEGHHVRAI